MDKAQSPLLAWPVERVARPATVVCLRCRGWVGVRPRGFFSQVSSAWAHGGWNRVGVNHQKRAPGLGLISLFLVQFSKVSTFKKHLMSHARATDFSRKTAYSINFATSVRHAQHCACRTHGEILKVYANIAGGLLDLLAGVGVARPEILWRTSWLICLIELN